MRVDTIQINENTRLAVWQDEDATDPREDDPEMTTESGIYKAWAEGNVYGIILEKISKLYEKNEDGTFNEGTAFDVWDGVDSIWGCYLDHQYTAEMVAKEYWGIA